MKRTVVAMTLVVSSAIAHVDAADTIKIAGSLDLSGPDASYGQAAQKGATFAAETLNKNGGVLGKQISLQFLDNGTNTQRAVNQSMQLARDGASLLISPQASGSTIAVSREVSGKLKVPMCTFSAGDDITMKQWQPYIFSGGPNQYMMFRAVAELAAKKGYKRIAVFAQDTAAGHAGNQRFVQFLHELDPKAEIVAEEYPRLGSPGFTGSLNKIMAAKPDFVFANLFGTDIITMTQQGQGIGFFKAIDNRIALLYDSDTLKALGDSAVVGTIGFARAPFNYIMQASPAGKDFVQKFKARFGDYPSEESVMEYNCVMTWAAAATAAKSVTPDDVMRALVSTEFDSPLGKFRIAPYDHMGNYPVYLGRLEQNKEFGQPVVKIDTVIPGSSARPTEQVVMQSRKSS